MSALQVRVLFGVTASALSIITYLSQQRRNRTRRLEGTSAAYEALIGNTTMVRLHNLSELVGRSIFVKMESLNPGGTGKDRAASWMIRNAEGSGSLPKPGTTTSINHSLPPRPDATTNASSPSSSSMSLEESIVRAMQRSRTGGLVVEGTSGSTGISLATLSASRGHACIVVLPDDQASEKRNILTTLGAVVHIVPNCAISNPNHYVNIARRIANLARKQHQIPAVFIDQFENESNFSVHYSTTGPEIYQQCPEIDAFVMSSGTGGTIAGVGKYLSEKKPSCRVVLVDPPGSALYNRIKHGVVYATQQQERGLKRHRYDTLAEGIGLDRLTHNFAMGVDCIDDAIRVSDQEAVDMAHFLLQTEGLWVGSSSAMNVVGAVRTARKLPPNSNVVTVICDGGQRHVTRFWNRDFIEKWGLVWPENNERIPQCLQD